MNVLLYLELVVPDAVALGMLGVIENIICWLDHASVNLLSEGLIWF